MAQAAVLQQVARAEELLLRVVALLPQQVAAQVVEPLLKVVAPLPQVVDVVQRLQFRQENLKRASTSLLEVIEASRSR